MINFFKVFLIVIIEQILFVITFAHTIDKGELGLLFILLLILYLGMYFKSKEVYNLKMNNKLFKLCFIPSWLISGILVTTTIFLLINNGLLADKCCDTWICISCYLSVPVYLILYLIALGVVECITCIVKKIKRKK